MPGFYTETQERNFRKANERVRRGGSDAAVCGARTRTGGACLALPVKGSVRCIKHCGPKVARAHRERQKQMFLSGKLPAAEWQRAEAKRAANRLRETWKRNPWEPGSTIDLGEHEWTFGREAGLQGRPTMPPAVLDWLRWKYRRLQIDRKRDTDWMRVLREELPKRTNAAGPPPEAVIVEAEHERASVARLWHASDTAQFSKRTRPDRPAVRAPETRPSLRRRGPPALQAVTTEEERADLSMFIYQHIDVLGPMFEQCREHERMEIVTALRAFLCDPSDRGARDRWMRIFLIIHSH